MRYAIPDIHGHIKTFEALLDKIGLNRDDDLYLLGDYIDRGPGVKEVLDKLMWFQSHGYHNVFPLLGNHEDWMLRLYTDGIENNSFDSWLLNGGYQTCQSFGCKEHIIEAPVKYMNFLRKLPTHIELDDYVLVHGGLNLYLADPVNNTSDGDKMWERPYGRYERWPWPIPGKQLIVGHTIRGIDVIRDCVEKNKNILFLDNGCYEIADDTGNLVAFNMDTKEIILQENIG